MPALDQTIGSILIVFAMLFGLLDMVVFYRLLAVTHGLRRVICALVLFFSTYVVIVYGLALSGWLPDGAELLSLLLRPVLVGLLGFLAAYGILDRRH